MRNLNLKILRKLARHFSIFASFDHDRDPSSGVSIIILDVNDHSEMVLYTCGKINTPTGDPMEVFRIMRFRKLKMINKRCDVNEPQRDD